MRTTTTQITTFLAILLLGAIAFAATSDDKPAAKKSPAAAKSSLDDELLKSLDNKPLEGADDLPDKPAPKPADAPAAKAGDKSDEKPPKKQQADNPLDDELRKSLGGDDLGGAGEDIGENQLTKIVGQMRAVEQRLSQSNSDATTQKQQKQIAGELAALLDQLQKQQAKQSQSGAKQPGGASGSKPGDPKQASGNSAAGNPNSQPARDSSRDVRANRSDRPDPLATRELMKRVLDGLGLPEKERERMLQAPPDEFLPSYEFAIKKYFERIVEEEAQ